MEKRRAEEPTIRYARCFDTPAGFGVLVEYLWGERGEAATTAFEDDVFVGLRLALNDPASTRVLSGAIFDQTTSSSFFLLEAGRRVGRSWTLELELRTFGGNLPPSAPSASFAADDHIYVRIARHW